MTTAKYTDTFPCSPEEFFNIVTDYEQYPTFLKEVKSIVVEKKGKQKLVEYKVSIIKEFSYSLLMTESKNKSLAWEFTSGDLFKSAQGIWTIEKDKDGLAIVTYEIEATMKMFIPKSIANTLIKVNLPNMFKAYQERAKELYG